MTDKRKPKTRKRPVGRPRYVFDEGVLALVETVPSPATVTQISEVLGISVSLFYEWMQEYPSFVEVVTRVRERANDEAENAFFKRVVGYDIVKTKTATDDRGVTQVLEEVHIPPEPGAALNFLKNRRPEKWRDTKTLDVRSDHAARVERAVKILESEGKDNGDD